MRLAVGEHVVTESGSIERPARLMFEDVLEHRLSQFAQLFEIGLRSSSAPAQGLDELLRGQKTGSARERTLGAQLPVQA